MQPKPDIVVSGINAGPNLGDDVIYSGTVAAAMEGRHLGLPALAVSLDGPPVPLTPAAVQPFAMVLQVVHSLDLPSEMPDARALAAEIDADVVLLVMTERYLALVPGVGPVP